MFKTIRNSIMGLALSLASIAAMPEEAKAGDYCREYTRTVYIGNRAQEAYGQACLQPNGDWMIVGEGLGNDIPNNVNDVSYIIHDNRREIRPSRVVYYDRNPAYYRRPAAPVFIWSINGHYRDGHYYNYNRNWKRGWDKHDRWDRHDNRGRGRGHH